MAEPTSRRKYQGTLRKRAVKPEHPKRSSRSCKVPKSLLALKHPRKPLRSPWPKSALQAFDMPGDYGWGAMLRRVLKSRGWSCRPPCHSIPFGTRGCRYGCVFIREFEATLRRQSPRRAFGRHGEVQEGHRLRELPLPKFAMWLQSSAEYRFAGPGTRVTLREDMAKILVRHGRSLPGADEGRFRFFGLPGTSAALTKTAFTAHFRNAPWYPETFVLPSERHAMSRRLRDCPEEYWITKPRDECSGAGICVWSASDPILAQHVCASAGRPQSVVQRYVANPLLVGGYKFHMRIHLLITNVSPVVAFVQAGGQCLFSTSEYSVSAEGLGVNFDPPVHISNTGLNLKPKQKEGFLKAKPVIGKGQQILMGHLEAHLAKTRPDFSHEALWSQILAMSAETARYIAQAPSVRRHGKPVPEQIFDIFGMDLVLDQNLKVWMCETNPTPSLSDQDRKVHGVVNPDYKKESKALSKVWHDSFCLLGLDAGRRQTQGTLRGWYSLDCSLANTLP